MRTVFLVLSLLLAGCGYTLVDPSERVNTITVPFIEDDVNGAMTRCLVKDLSQSVSFRPSRDGRYCLEVIFLSSKDENVGFRYDQNGAGELLTTVIPSETRWSILVEITVKDTYQGCLLFGPARISASHTFDHDWYVSRDGDNVFSMGQVTDYFDAKDGVYPVLAAKVSRKIVDLLEQLGP